MWNSGSAWSRSESPTSAVPGPFTRVLGGPRRLMQTMTSCSSRPAGWCWRCGTRLPEVRVGSRSGLPRLPGAGTVHALEQREATRRETRACRSRCEWVGDRFPRSIVPTTVPVSRCRPGTIITERVEENAVREARIVRKSSDTIVRSVAIPSLVNLLCLPASC